MTFKLFSPQDCWETLVVQTGRALILFACEHYLSKSLFRDLKSLTVSSSNDAEIEYEPVELDELPAPNTRSANGPVKGTSSSLHSRIASYTFASCFADGCTLFALFMFQEIGILSARGRMISWSICLHVLLASVVTTIPLSSNLLLTYQSPIGKLSRKRSLFTRVFFAFIPYVAFLLLFWKIPLPVGVSSTSALEKLLARVVVVGTFIIGLFAGVGAAVNISRFLPFFKDSRSSIPTDLEISSAEEAMARVGKDLSTRRNEQSAKTSQQGGTSWMSRVLGNSESSSIQREIDGLVALAYQMTRNVEELKRIRAEDVYLRSGQGRIFHVIGIVFSVYCVFRTASSVFNLFAPFQSHTSGNGRSYPDLVSHLLTYLFSLLPSIDMTPERIAAVSRQISLVLVGAIILSSIRFVLRLVSRFLRLTNQSLGASLLLLLLAQLMGTYLISTLVQLRTAFPPNPSLPGEDALSANVLTTLPPYETFGSAFDWSYLLSLSATGAYIWFDRKLNSTF